jgi:hypothetical protein
MSQNNNANQLHFQATSANASHVIADFRFALHCLDEPELRGRIGALHHVSVPVAILLDRNQRCRLTDREEDA